MINRIIDTIKDFLKDSCSAQLLLMGLIIFPLNFIIPSIVFYCPVGFKIVLLVATKFLLTLVGGACLIIGFVMFVGEIVVKFIDWISGDD